MRRKLLVRMSLNFMSVLLIVLVILGIMISRFIWINELGRSVNSMKETARSIATDYGDLIDRQITTHYFVNKINSAAKDSSVWLIDKSGLHLNVTGLDENTPDLSTEEVQEYIQTVLQQDEPILLRDAFSTYFGTGSVITVAMPLSRDGEKVGAVFLHRKVNVINRSFIPMLSELWLTAMVAIFIGLCLTAFTAMRITKPLRELASASQRLAQGDMTAKVRISSHADDEIGEVGLAFNAMVDALRETEEQRKGFVANVSHELRSPITSIAGYLQGILDGTIPPEQEQHYLQVVYDETNRMKRLINDLLNLSRIEAGTVPLNPIDFNVNEMVRRVLIKFEGRLDEKEMDVDLGFEDEPMNVHADSDRIEQVISNLVDNAIKFCGSYGKLTLRTYSIPGNRIAVEVEDDGAGIDEKDLPHVFERFYTVDKAHTSGKGTGLGLPIVRQILLQHGQDISVVSETGKGTKFTFTLQKGTAKELSDGTKNM